MKRHIIGIALFAMVASGLTFTPSTASAAFNDEYVYVTTRKVDHSHMHPIAKASLFPLTVALDTALLPFTVIAGFVG